MLYIPGIPLSVRMFPQEMGDPAQHKVHAGDRHAVAQRLVPCAVRCAGDVRPAVREALQALALKGRQPPDQVPFLHDAFVLADVLVTDPFLIAPA